MLQNRDPISNTQSSSSSLGLYLVYVCVTERKEVRLLLTFITHLLNPPATWLQDCVRVPVCVFAYLNKP